MSSVMPAAGGKFLRGEQYAQVNFSSAGSVTLDGVATIYYMDVTISAVTDYTKCVISGSWMNGSSNAAGLAAILTSNTNMRVYCTKTGETPTGFFHIMEFMPQFTVYSKVKVINSGTSKSELLSTNTAREKMVFIGGSGGGTNGMGVGGIYYDVADDKVYIKTSSADKGIGSIFVVDMLHA